MDRLEFEGQLGKLRNDVIVTVTEHFKSHEIGFDLIRFLDQTETNLDQFLREAYFYGAEVFPIDP